MSINYKLFFDLGDKFTENELNKAYTSKYNNLINSSLSDMEKVLYKNKLHKIYKIAKKNNSSNFFKNNIIFNDNDNIIFLKNQKLYHNIEIHNSDNKNKHKNKKISFA
jgi:hypothetical protein